MISPVLTDLTDIGSASASPYPPKASSISMQAIRHIKLGIGLRCIETSPRWRPGSFDLPQGMARLCADATARADADCAEDECPFIRASNPSRQKQKADVYQLAESMLGRLRNERSERQ